MCDVNKRPRSRCIGRHAHADLLGTLHVLLECSENVRCTATDVRVGRAAVLGDRRRSLRRVFKRRMDRRRCLLTGGFYELGTFGHTLANACVRDPLKAVVRTLLLPIKTSARSHDASLSKLSVTVGPKPCLQYAGARAMELVKAPLKKALRGPLLVSQELLHSV